VLSSGRALSSKNSLGIRQDRGSVLMLRRIESMTIPSDWFRGTPLQHPHRHTPPSSNSHD